MLIVNSIFRSVFAKLGSKKVAAEVNVTIGEPKHSDDADSDRASTTTDKEDQGSDTDSTTAPTKQRALGIPAPLSLYHAKFPL